MWISWHWHLQQKMYSIILRMRATYFLNTLFVILSSSVALAHIYFVHIIHYFSCSIKHWSHKIQLQNLMSLLFTTILRGGWASWWATCETVSSIWLQLHVKRQVCSADMNPFHLTIFCADFQYHISLKLLSAVRYPTRIPTLCIHFIQCTYYYSADDTTTNTILQNLIVQLTSEDI
jgi:hypothetical protein